MKCSSHLLKQTIELLLNISWWLSEELHLAIYVLSLRLNIYSSVLYMNLPLASEWAVFLGCVRKIYILPDENFS